MWWSNTWVGTRAGIKAAMGRYSDALSGASKEEFDAARPHLEALVDMNFNSTGDPVLSLQAHGHAYTSADNQDLSASLVSCELKTVGPLCE